MMDWGIRRYYTDRQNKSLRFLDQAVFNMLLGPEEGGSVYNRTTSVMGQGTHWVDSSRNKSFREIVKEEEQPALRRIVGMYDEYHGEYGCGEMVPVECSCSKGIGPFFVT